MPAARAATMKCLYSCLQGFLLLANVLPGNHFLSGAVGLFDIRLSSYLMFIHEVKMNLLFIFISALANELLISRTWDSHLENKLDLSQSLKKKNK